MFFVPAGSTNGLNHDSGNNIQDIVKIEVCREWSCCHNATAIFCGIVLLLATVSTSENSSDTETGAMIAYTVGAVLSMFAVGRVIELLQKSHVALNTLIEIEKFKLKRADSNAPVE